MTRVESRETSFVIRQDKRTLVFPKGTVSLTSSRDSKAVNFKLMGSRKTILSVPCEELGFGEAEEAVRMLSREINREN